MIHVSKPSIGPEEIEAVRRSLETGWLGMGPLGEEFEKNCCEIIGCTYFIALSSGSKALEIALAVSGLEKGDEVLVPSLTYAATIQSILNASLKPVFVDCNMEDANISVEDVVRKITPRTKIIMPVHLRGRSCQMEQLREIAERFNLGVIEDAAHAFASRCGDRYVGQDSYMACFSFGPIKNITCGAGGGIATNDETVARFILNFRNMGISRSTWDRYDPKSTMEKNPWEYEVIAPGGRCYLPEMNAAIGLAQLQRLGDFRRVKKGIIQRYEAEFMDFDPVTTLRTDSENDFLYIYPILVPKGQRAGLMNRLLDHGIHTSIHYPANHRQPFFRRYCRERLINTETLCERLITLPSYMDLTQDQHSYVIEQVKAFFE